MKRIYYIIEERGYGVNASGWYQRGPAYKARERTRAIHYAIDIAESDRTRTRIVKITEQREILDIIK